MMKILLPLAFVFAVLTPSWSQDSVYSDDLAQKISVGSHQVLGLWPAGGPAEENELTGPEAREGCVGNISHAEFSITIPEKQNGMAIVVTPGGGYRVVCTDTEGKQIADLLSPLGITTIVVKYRIPNEHHLIPATDARRAIRTVRHNAKHWGINPAKVGVWGFSAGGHLASTVSTTFDSGRADAEDRIERQNSRPDFSILFYPVITMEKGVTHNGSRGFLLGADPSDELVKRYSNELQVTNKTPPTFILHAADDKVVQLENSLRYYQQLTAHGVPSRLMVYETGGHGPGAFKSNPTWQPVFEDWLKKR